MADQTAAARAKEAAARESLEERRGQRQRAFACAQLAELDLPLLPADEDVDMGDGTATTATAGGRSGGKHGSAGKRKRSGSAGAVAVTGASLLASELMASEPFEASALVGTGTLNGEPEVADEGAQGSASAGAGGASGGAAAGSERVRVDFSSLDALERTSKPADFEKHLGAEISEASRAIDAMTPNMKAIEQYEEVQQRLLEVETEYMYDAVKASQKEANSSFQNARNQRYSKFMSCFKVISESIDDKYKDLTQTEGVLVGGTAYLSIEDTTEPYLHGIKYTAMPPAKRFRPMMELSGGERTVAALALLFAIWEFRPSPFFVMDEIDAALDNVNVTRVAQYIRERAAEGKIQFVVISLKDTFYHMAHSLVGVYRDRSDESSDVVTLDLESLEQPPGAAEPRRSSGASTSSFRKSLEVK